MFVNDRDVLVAAQEARRAASQAQATELRALADYARRHEDDEFAHLEVAPLLHISDRAAYHRLQFAQDLVTYLPRTLAVLADGHIEEYKAQLITDAVRCLTEDQALAVEDRVLDAAPAQTPAQLKAALIKAVMAVDPEGAEYRRVRKDSERRVSSRPTEDGEAVLFVYHNAATIAAMHTAIHTRALQLKQAGGELRTLAQVEADVAAELIHGTIDHCKVEVQLVLPIADPAQPAEVAGIGPITRNAARELAAQATSWRWLRTDPDTGAVVDITAASYKPPAALAEFIKIRDRTCRHPGCVRPAKLCDIDHNLPWPAGPTSNANCTCLCRRHHRAKHQAGWQVRHLAPGILQWTSPLGFTHRVGPTPVTDPLPLNPPPWLRKIAELSDPPPF